MHPTDAASGAAGDPRTLAQAEREIAALVATVAELWERADKAEQRRRELHGWLEQQNKARQEALNQQCALLASRPTASQFRELRDLHAQLSRHHGAWEFCREAGEDGEDIVKSLRPLHPHGQGIDYGFMVATVEGWDAETAGRFIALCRNLVPALLNELAALRGGVPEQETLPLEMTP